MRYLLLVASAFTMVSCQHMPWNKNKANLAHQQYADPYAQQYAAYNQQGTQGYQYPQQQAWPQQQPNQQNYYYQGQQPQQNYPTYDQAQVYPASGNYEPPPSNSGGRTHTVRRGDTLFGLSKKYGVSVSQIMQANSLNSDIIRVGSTLQIP